jgi:hypothetical protein
LLIEVKWSFYKKLLGKCNCPIKSILSKPISKQVKRIKINQQIPFKINIVIIFIEWPSIQNNKSIGLSIFTIWKIAKNKNLFINLPTVLLFIIIYFKSQTFVWQVPDGIFSETKSIEFKSGWFKFKCRPEVSSDLVNT